MVTCSFRAHAAPEGAGESHAAKLFEKACYSCHNIGGGDKKGPDLKNLLKRRDRQWSQRFILTPKALRDAGDQAAVQLFNKYAPEEMADQTLAPDQVDELLELIEELSKKNKTFIPTSGKLARRPTPADVPAGRRLFTGEAKLEKGGASCISCHSVEGIGTFGGGRLGPDLTEACIRYTEVELAALLKEPAFPTMSKLFAKQPLSKEEVVQLYAYLYSAKTRRPDPAQATSRYVGLGAAGMLGLFGAMSFIWRGRLRGGSKLEARSST